jgi:MFS family permease
MIGGYIAKYCGWRWDYWLAAIVLGITWLVLLFGLPETLYNRMSSTSATNTTDTHEHSNKLTLKHYTQLLTFRPPNLPTRPLKLWDFTHVFTMLAYPSVTLPAMYYSLCFGFGSVLFAITGSAAFGSVYHFDSSTVGLAIGCSTFVGTLIGELSAGPVSDRLLYLYRKKHDGEAVPEARLQAIWPGFILLPLGTAIEGVCLQYRTHWIGPVMGIGVSAFGLQIVSTNIFAYITDVCLGSPFLLRSLSFPLFLVTILLFLTKQRCDGKLGHLGANQSLTILSWAVL